MKYYFIGIKGSGMSSLATILHDLGNTVIGYDDTKEHKYTEDNLVKRNIPIYHDNTYNLTDEIVIYSAAFKDYHPEIVRAKEKGLKLFKYNEMLGELTKQFKTISISGCHGKTTTSMMLAFVLNNIIKVNYLIGEGTGYANKDNEYLVIEACEYRRHFLEYDNTYSIITNIELDHVDYYKDINDMISAYQEFTNNTKEALVICGDDANIRKLNINKNYLYYGFNDNNDIIAKNIKKEGNHNTFDVYIKGEFYGKIESLLFGDHMVLNTLAVIGICELLYLNKEEVIENIKHFKGAKKRFDEVVYNNMVLVDDYAHHPTEVDVTIKSARQKYPDKEIVTVYMPDTYSRLQAFYEDYIKILSTADKVYITPVGKGREKQEEYPNVTSNLIIDNLEGSELIELDNPEKLLKHKDSIILFMSCGNIYVLKEKLEELLKESR